ncbi:unnamed protein product [Microthlaspi erraticum]|uniref:Uncharacterized protein n=1 Tax=Microthlaspi erraticum TaxID=1685480 RepID=A0A6D2KPY7_9BRAS|nr:unnamed protein product [Microthlaspi erraticum]
MSSSPPAASGEINRVNSTASTNPANVINASVVSTATVSDFFPVSKSLDSKLSQSGILDHSNSKTNSGLSPPSAETVATNGPSFTCFYRDSSGSIPLFLRKK